MDNHDHSANANSFGRAAEIYERGRPGYPAAALDWLLPAGRPRVVDLGAGTGKLTRQIRARGLEVTAVDPSERMLAQLTLSVPGVPVLIGSAERIPMPEDSADVVLVAQAWHWVDPPAASAELARILRPGGTVAPLWNVRDETTDWVARWTEIVHRGDSLETSYRDPELGEAFTEPEHATFHWAHRLRTADLRTLAASRSHLLLLPDDEREALLSEIDELVATHPDLRGRAEVDVPYRTECYRARLR